MSIKINLNSDWGFTKDSGTIQDIGSMKFSKVTIPHTWNGIDGQNGGDNYYRGLCWYTKNFTVNVKPNKNYYIEFEAVNSVANVYLNGKCLGEHRGGYSAFRFDITNVINSGENTLLVSADNSEIPDVYPLWADFTFYGGIYRDVNLIETNEVHFEMMDYASSGVYVSQRNVDKKNAEIEVKALIANSSDEAEVKCNVKFLDSDGNTVTQGSQKVLVKDKDNAIVLLTVDNPILWNATKNPYLYSCEVELVTGGNVVDSVVIPTGLRFFEFDGDRGFVLNGHQTRLNGVSRHQDREAVGNALTREHQIQDIELIKEVGANSIRLAHYQHNKFFYDLCDKYGMVVWAEIPYISKTADVEDYAANAINQMHELVKQNYNHASIVMWGVQNEIGIFPDEKPLNEIVKTINAVVKESDTTRVTTQAQVMMIDENDPANWETDTVAFNQYHGWYVGNTSGYDDFITKFRKANPNKCLGYSEYGAEGILSWHTDDPKVKDYTEEYHAKFHEEVMDIFNRYDFIWGTYVWNMFDFGSDMRDEGGIKGRNNKGLVTFDRAIKKDAFYFYKSLWSDEPTLHIASKRFVDRHLDIIKVKVYSNQGEVTLYNNGAKIETQKSEGNIFVFKVKLNKGKNKVIAISGNLEDLTVFRKVKKPRKKYILPDAEAKKGINIMGSDDDVNVANWFDTDIHEVGELQFPKGYFSIKDKIKDIMENEEGLALMEKYFKAMMENERFSMAKKMSMEFIFNFQKEMFPDEFVYMINCELNKIKK